MGISPAVGFIGWAAKDLVKKILTGFMVRVQTLQQAIVPLKRIRPPSMNGTKQLKTEGQMKGEVMVGYKFMVENLPKSLHVRVHVVVVQSSPIS